MICENYRVKSLSAKDYIYFTFIEDIHLLLQAARGIQGDPDCGDALHFLKSIATHIYIEKNRNVPCLSQMLNTIMFELTLPIAQWGRSLSWSTFETTYPQERINKPTSKRGSLCVAINICLLMT